MGARERREREKQEVHQGIRAAARRIAREHGWGAVTIRRIAEQVEYAPPIVYEYFANKEALLLDLMREGFRLLTEAMQAAAESEGDTQNRVLSVADAYWEFAQTHHDLYQVMHGLGGVAMDGTEAACAAEPVCALVLSVLNEWSRENQVRLADLAGSGDILWSLLHGLVVTTGIGRVSHGQKLARRAIADLLFAWRNAKGTKETSDDINHRSNRE